MVSATIPGYRAPATAVRRDLDSISALGVEVRFGISIGRDRTLDELLNDGFDDIVVAVGAQRGLRLGIDGEDIDGVMDGLDFLRKARRGEAVKIGRRIAVIGGGDVAVDCARSARRLSEGEVEILYRRTVDQMPAHPEEIRDLLAEGISIRELVAPRRVVAEDGRLRSVECAVMTLGEPDASGRPRPVEVPGGDITLEFDTLIVAIGQQADLGVFTGLQVTCSPSGYLEVDAGTLETSISRVYAGGDLRDPGPSNIVDACGDGQRIARAILKSNRPEHRLDPSPPRNRAGLLARRAHRLSRVETPRKPGVNLSGFDEVIETLTSDAAAREAARCLDCDIICSTCDGVCPNRAIVTYELDPSITRLGFSAGQTPQVAVIADLCNECGNCATFCPTVGIPWQDKPRLYFDRGDFEAETDNAFMLLRINGLPAIQGRFHGETHQLVMDGDPAKQAIESAPYAGEVSIKPSIIMYTLLHGLTESMPHLPIPEAEPGWLIHPDDAL
jgi:putative selenate reductase